MFFSSIKKIILPILLILLLIMFLILENMISHGHPVTSWEEYNYSLFEIQKLKRYARNGDNDAAYKLGMYYYLTRQNDEHSIFWFRIAADGNHIEAIKELIRYESLLDTRESKQIVKNYIQQLKKLALENEKNENFYISDLEIDSSIFDDM